MFFVEKLHHKIQRGLIPQPMLISLLLITHYGASLAHTLKYQCIHDSEEIQTLIYGPVDVETGLRYSFTPHGINKSTNPQVYQPMPPSNAPDEVRRGFYATAFDSMRIVTSSLDLEDSNKYCTKANDVVPNFQGANVSCNDVDIFTLEKKKNLLNKILPAAFGLISSALKVNRVVGNLKNSGCTLYNVPKSHSTEGIPNADYVLYLSVAPIPGNVVGWGGSCKRDTAGRVISGRANFSPKTLVWDDANTHIQRKIVRIAVHEILHALGFNYNSWKNHFLSGNPIASETRRGKIVTYFKSKLTVEKTRAHFNCQNAKGPEISQKSHHWDTRNHRDDIMTTTYNSGMYLSHITLATFEDSGHYKVDWSKAETPKWLYKAGCGLMYATCNTTAGGLGTYFCNEGDGCEFNHLSMGQCDIMNYTSLPTWAQYFRGEPRKGGGSVALDYCPVIRESSNRRCNLRTNSAPNTSIIPMYYGDDGRCFWTNGVSKKGSNIKSTQRANCIQTRCVNNIVQFKMPDNELWISCKGIGASMSLSQYGYNGAVICPHPYVICDTESNTLPASKADSATYISSSILSLIIYVFVLLISSK
eukprot:Tbor_TRINITY_DN6150_c2_g2::TRINITY_DN6150_c2_g2_i1::g.22494::m.22494/K01404/GP63; leishmanolysin